MDDAVLARAQARVGTTLQGKYHLDAVLGVGGMACVYAATHRNKKRFAIKLLHPELSVSGDLRARFLREGYAANSVQHDGTVAVLDDDLTEDGGAFLVMELLEGDSVEDLWRRSGRRLPAELVTDVGVQLLDVLSAAHDHGVVHRDIKPANLFLTRDGKLKVLDFGIARVMHAVARFTTQSGATYGTPPFMSPEQAQGCAERVGPASDVWAAGATLYTLLCGQFVHESDNPQMIVLRAATRPARKVADVCAVPQDLAAVVDRALAFDPKDRWPNAAAMRDALRALHLRDVPRTERPVSSEPAALPSFHGRLPAGRRLAVTGAMVLVVTLLAALVASRRTAAHRASGGARAAWVLAGEPASAGPPQPVRIADLPGATAKPPLPPPRVAAPAPSSAPERRGCTPPYTIGPAGSLRWKADCL